MQKKLNAMMEEAAEKLEFERAAKYRNRLWALAHVQAHQGINPRGVEEADVFAIVQKGGQTCIQVFSSATIRTGATAPISRAPTVASAGRGAGLLHSQFYDDKLVPRCVFLSGSA